VDNSVEMGLSAEKKFVQVMKGEGNTVGKSTKNQDMFEHWDYLINDLHRVEVKGRKKRKRHDSKPDDEIIYVEFSNVRGNDGWIYGKADYVAFERPEGFLIVPRKKLVDLAENLVSSSFTKYPTIYKSYRRRDRPEEHVGLIRYDDLLTIPHRLVKFK